MIKLNELSKRYKDIISLSNFNKYDNENLASIIYAI